METTNQLLDEVKRRHALGSDYALAARLGLTRSMVSAYRTGKRHLGDEPAIKVAALLDLDPGYVLACMEAERTHNDAARAVWARMAELVKRHGVAAGILLLVAAPAITPTPANASPDKAGASMYIMTNALRYLVRLASSLATGRRFIAA